MLLVHKKNAALCITRKAMEEVFVANHAFEDDIKTHILNNDLAEHSNCFIATNASFIPRFLSDCWSQFLNPIVKPEKLSVHGFIGPDPDDDYL